MRLSPVLDVGDSVCAPWIMKHGDGLRLYLSVRLGDAYRIAVFYGDVSSVIPGVVWAMADWLIPAGSIAYGGKTAIEIAHAIVAAAVGYLRANPDGTLTAARLFKQTVPKLSALPTHPASVDVVLNEWDILSLSEQDWSGDGNNRVIIRPDAGGNTLSLEIDGRPAGYNGGKTQFVGGENAVALAFPPSLQAMQAKVTAGDVQTSGSRRMTITETLQLVKFSKASSLRDVQLNTQ